MWNGGWYVNGELQDVIFQQYTGEKLRKQELYEGDILKVTDDSGSISYHPIEF